MAAELPPAAVQAAAEVLARFYKAAWPDDPVDPPMAPFIGEAREVLAAAELAREHDGVADRVRHLSKVIDRAGVNVYSAAYIVRKLDEITGDTHG